MKGKKLLSVIIAIAMVLGAMGIPAFAEGEVVNEASVNGTPYATLKAAIDAAQDGDTIKLLSDVTASEADSGMIWFHGTGSPFKSGKFYFDCNGHVLTGGIADGWGESDITIVNGKSVETTYTEAETGQMIQYSSLYNYQNDMVVEDGEFTASYVVVLQAGGTVEIKNGTYVIKTEGDDIIYSEGGVTTIQDGIFKGAENIENFYAISALGEGVVNVYGGTFEGNLREVDNGQINIYGGTFSVDPTEYVPEGYEVVDNGNGTWSVREVVLNPVAKIGETNYATLANAFAAAQDGDTVEIIADMVTMPDDTVITKAVTIKGSGKDTTTIKVNNRVKIMSGNVSFEDLKIDGSAVTSNSIYNSVIYVGADDISFKNVNFYEGPDRTYDANVQVGYSGHNLKFEGCDFSGAFRGVHIADAICDTVFDDCVFYPGAYPFNVNTGMPASGPSGEIIVRNSTLKGWTSWSGAVEQVTFENCKFEPGNYNNIVAYNNATFKNCSFTDTIIEAGNTDNFKWVIDNCTKNGEILRRSEQFFDLRNSNWTYQTYSFIFPTEAKIIDNAKTTGAEITLDNLNAHANVDINADTTYKVVVDTAPKAETDKANEAIDANTEDTNTSKAIFDITVKKIDSYGVETDLGGTEPGSITNQQVTLTLSETPQAGTKVYVYHVKADGTVENVAEVVADGTNKVTFTAPSFSTYAVTYTAGTLTEDEITKKIGVAFERVGDTTEYNIVLKSLDAGKTINRFMSTDLTFEIDVKEGTVDYVITPAANINLVNNNGGRYEFNLNGLVQSGVTGTDITIGSVTFDGYGKIDFGVKTAATNIVNTAEINNNIVDYYTPTGDGVNTGFLDLTNKLIDVVFKAPTKDLDINITYNNKITNQKLEYQDMTVTISGGDLAANKVVKLGTTPVNENTNATVAYDSVNSVYTINVADELTKNIAYTVTVEGAGYRTARYTVTMTADKELNFWNNVQDSNAEVEVGKAESAKQVTFLAGDIVKDSNINIYDLSAVVSYFGTINNVDASSAYAKYDLNRDGVIDSKDVAYVLVSWGN